MLTLVLISCNACAKHRDVFSNVGSNSSCILSATQPKIKKNGAETIYREHPARLIKKPQEAMI